MSQRTQTIASYKAPLALLLPLVLLFFACSKPAVPEPPVSFTPGQVVSAQDIYGTFFVYVPKGNAHDLRILALIHGTPPADLTEEEDARYYIEGWVKFADENRFVLIAPAFSQKDFSSREGDHAEGGYRGLFGRKIMADAWLLRLVNAYRQRLEISDPQFYLYGHSAGGQFAARFLVTHPELVKRAVIASAATYPQPKLDVAYPFGMGKFDADIIWDAETTTRVTVAPDKEKWLAATKVPVTVIVGLSDTSELPAYPGQDGKNRFVIGRNWVKAMGKLAEENGLESRIKTDLVPGRGHAMADTISYAQKALVR